MRGATIAVAMALATAAVLSPLPAIADGEAGLVIQHGDGGVDSYCVPFEGGSIDGDDLLRAANVSFEQVSGLVCTVGSVPGEGCPGASTIASCTCQCKPGGGSCVYWSYFSKQYGGRWIYSISGFTSLSAKDGDMQAWRWGPGGPSSAPPPAEVSFEQVCGHPPGRIQPQPEPTATPEPVQPTSTVPAAAPSVTPATATEPAATATATSALTTLTAATSTPSPSVESTATRVATEAPTALSDAANTAGGGSGGSGTRAKLAAFVAIASLLIAGTLIGIRERSRRGR